MATVTSVANGSSSCAVSKESTPESKIKDVIEKGLSDLLKTGDSQDYDWSLDVDVDPQAIQNCAKFFQEHDSRIPDSPSDDRRKFF